MIDPTRVLGRREAIAAGFAAVALACFSERPDATEPDDEEVVVRMTPQLTFDPERVEIRAGQTIAWENVSDFAHTATGDASKANDAASVRLPAGAQPWDSGTVGAGQTYRRSFTTPGEYRYFCIPHESFGMIGTIVVNP